MNERQKATSEYLNQSYHLNEEINSKIEHLNLLEDRREHLTTIYKDTPPSTTREVDSMQKATANIMDLRVEINEKIDEFVDLQREIMHVIDKVPNSKYRSLLTYRYLNFQEWELIALEMGCSAKHIYKLHREALDKIAELTKS